ncbi:MAG: EVE domain-containing protein, partial [Cyanobacteria bacterium]|nr:EVE domain-containing protein [Cyanobacteria bacterium CG_2015-04_32_10]
LKERFSGDEFLLVKKGNRLSVMPVPENLINLII